MTVGRVVGRSSRTICCVSNHCSSERHVNLQRRTISKIMDNPAFIEAIEMADDGERVSSSAKAEFPQRHAEQVNSLARTG